MERPRDAILAQLSDSLELLKKILCPHCGLEIVGWENPTPDELQEVVDILSEGHPAELTYTHDACLLSKDPFVILLTLQDEKIVIQRPQRPGEIPTPTPSPAGVNPPELSAPTPLSIPTPTHVPSPAPPSIPPISTVLSKPPLARSLGGRGSSLRGRLPPAAPARPPIVVPEFFLSRPSPAPAKPGMSPPSAGPFLHSVNPVGARFGPKGIPVPAPPPPLRKMGLFEAQREQEFRQKRMDSRLTLLIAVSLSFLAGTVNGYWWRRKASTEIETVECRIKQEKSRLFLDELKYTPHCAGIDSARIEDIQTVSRQKLRGILIVPCKVAPEKECAGEIQFPLEGQDIRKSYSVRRR